MRAFVLINLISFTLTLLLYGSGEIFAEDVVEADRLALQDLFGEKFLSSNIQAVRQRASLMDGDEKYLFLKRQVIQGAGLQSLRVRGQFLPTSPSPGHPLIASPLQHQLYLLDGDPIAEMRKKSGGVISSLVMDLISVAKDIGKLDELAKEITERFSGDSAHRKNGLALQFVIAVESERFEDATEFFDLLVPEMVDFIETDIDERWAELLVLIYGLRHPQTREYVGEFFVHELANHLEYHPDHAPDIMIDHFRSLTGIYFARRFGGTSTSLSPWISSSYFDHITRGEGRPHAHWRINNSTVSKFSGHETDYLTYAIPLRGDFQVECVLSATSNRHTGCVVAGRAIEIDWNQSIIKTGNYRKASKTTKLEPRLARGGGTARFRAVVVGHQLQSFFNGRLVHEERLPQNYDPWFSLCNWRRSHPEVNDLRITGSPVIPDEIKLLSDPNLDGWSPYYEEGFGAHQGFWSAAYDDEQNLIVRGYPRVDLAGVGMEKLLRYHRPMVEDGVISYEFYYEPDKKMVHPALDRMAFLLEPDGVKLHWITDGRHEKNGLDPFNKKFEDASSRGPQRLPFKVGDWNQCELSVEGDRLSIQLNGELIYERVIEANNQRTFGLFHYADLTEALVRDVRWRGDWSKEFPSIHDQILANHLLDEVNEMSAALPAFFEHDFANGAPPELFDFSGDQTVIAQRPNGIATQYSVGKYLQEIRTCLQLGGDFDLVAQFSDLKVTMPAHLKRRGGVGLVLWTDTLAEDSFALYRRKDWDGQKVAYARKTTNSEGDRKYNGFRYTSETVSGKLRMVRKGNRLYSLFAEGNSPNYRLVTEEEIPIEDIRPQGLRLVMQSGGTVVLTEGTWNRLTIRADKIFGLPPADGKKILSELALDQPNSLTTERLINLEPGSNFVRSSVGASEEMTTPEGPRFRIESNQFQNHLFIEDRLPAASDTCDIGAEFEIHQLDAPEKLGTHSEVALETILWQSRGDDELMRLASEPKKITLIIRQKANGIRELIARVVKRNIAGKYVYLPIRSVPVTNPDSLRFVAQEGKLYYLYSETDSSDWIVIAEIPFEGDLANAMTSMHQYANGEGRVTDVTWRRLMTRSVGGAK